MDCQSPTPQCFVDQGSGAKPSLGNLAIMAEAWTWDSARGSYYYWSQEEDCFVYQTGLKLDRNYQEIYESEEEEREEVPEGGHEEQPSVIMTKARARKLKASLTEKISPALSPPTRLSELGAT